MRVPRNAVLAGSGVRSAGLTVLTTSFYNGASTPVWSVYAVRWSPAGDTCEKETDQSPTECRMNTRCGQSIFPNDPTFTSSVVPKELQQIP